MQISADAVVDSPLTTHHSPCYEKQPCRTHSPIDDSRFTIHESPSCDYSSMVVLPWTVDRRPSTNLPSHSGVIASWIGSAFQLAIRSDEDRIHAAKTIPISRVKTVSHFD